MMSGDVDLIAYAMPDNESHPAVFLQKLSKLPEHEHFYDSEIYVEFLIRRDPLVKSGKRVTASVHLPTVQGKLRDLFEMLLANFFGQLPQFLIVIDKEFWDNATDNQKEALVYHEMCHIKQEVDKHGELRFDSYGNPSFGIVGHDLEAFNDEVKRYGAWRPEISDFIEVVKR